VRLPVMDGKHSSPCVVRPGARQWDFTVQNATVPFAVRPDEKRTAKSLPCVFVPLPCASGARQTLCFPLCVAPRQLTYVAPRQP
jgi:hypothetical protein